MSQQSTELFKVNKDTREKTRVHEQGCRHRPREEDKKHGRWYENKTVEELIPILQEIRQTTTTPIVACGTCNPDLPQEVRDLFRD